MWSQHINCRRCSSTPPTRRYRKEILSWIVCVCTVLFFATDTQEIIETFVFQRCEKKQVLNKEWQMQNISSNRWAFRINLRTSHLVFIFVHSGLWTESYLTLNFLAHILKEETSRQLSLYFLQSVLHFFKNKNEWFSSLHIRESSYRPASVANIKHKPWSFRGDRSQWIFFGQAAASRCEVSPTFRELTPSPFSGCAGGLFEPKLMTRCPTLRYVYLRSAGCGVECDPST
jgi:hypothetical protein